MQRGAGPGGDIGDFGAVLFVDGRLRKHVNVSANLGYILNSNPKGLTAISCCWIGRMSFSRVSDSTSRSMSTSSRSPKSDRLTYVGGQTPNAFNNNPVEVLGGVKIYPRRWFGFGLAYRRHLNPAGSGSLQTG